MVNTENGFTQPWSSGTKQKASLAGPFVIISLIGASKTSERSGALFLRHPATSYKTILCGFPRCLSLPEECVKTEWFLNFYSLHCVKILVKEGTCLETHATGLHSDNLMQGLEPKFQAGFWAAAFVVCVIWNPWYPLHKLPLSYNPCFVKPVSCPLSKSLRECT